jgi:hypothetical protein
LPPGCEPRPDLALQWPVEAQLCLSASKLWFADPAAARFLWESLRWLYREQGNSLMAYYDPKSPAAAVPRIPFWLPKASLTLVIDSPIPMNEDLPIFPPV